ncbi:MAG: hypothetical protein WBI17_11800 [Clostridiaceae bacterium]
MKLFKNHTQEENEHCNKPENGNHNHKKHMLHMILCCALPIIVLLSIPFVSKFSPGSSKFLILIAPFICPIMMLSMIPMMFGGKKKSNHHDNQNETIN